jgi:hypothetical protein
MEARIQNLVGQGEGFLRYRVASMGDAKRQLWLVVDKQLGTPSIPTFNVEH